MIFCSYAFTLSGLSCIFSDSVIVTVTLCVKLLGCQTLSSSIWKLRLKASMWTDSNYIPRLPRLCCLHNEILIPFHDYQCELAPCLTSAGNSLPCSSCSHHIAFLWEKPGSQIVSASGSTYGPRTKRQQSHSPGAEHTGYSGERVRHRLHAEIKSSALEFYWGLLQIPNVGHWGTTSRPFRSNYGNQVNAIFFKNLSKKT